MAADSVSSDKLVWPGQSVANQKRINELLTVQLKELGIFNKNKTFKMTKTN